MLESFVKSYVADHKDVSLDQVKEAVDGIRNPLLVETIAKGFGKDGFSVSNKTDKLELMTQAIQGGWFKTLEEYGLSETFYQEWGIKNRVDPVKLTEEFGEKAANQCIADFNDEAVLSWKNTKDKKYNATKAVFSVDEKLKAPTVTITDSDGKTRVFIMRIMTSSDMLYHDKEIKRRATEYGQKPSLQNEEYWSEITRDENGKTNTTYFGTVGSIAKRNWGGAIETKQQPAPKARSNSAVTGF